MRKYALLCAAVAIAIVPDALPVTGAVLIARAWRRYRARKQIAYMVARTGRQPWTNEVIRA